MSPLVPVEVQDLIEAPPAVGTIVGLFSGVALLMGNQVGALDKSFPTLGAGEGPVSRVEFLVADKI